MENFLTVLNFSLSITLPICFIILLGALLNKLRIINDNFIHVSSKLLFNITLPALLFISILKTDFSGSIDFALVGFGIISVILAYLLFEILAYYLIPNKANRGVVIQGSFRSNMGIIGLAYCVNAYGESVFAVASIYLAGVTTLFNVLSVITLNRSLDQGVSIIKTLKSIAKNPLILSIVTAIFVSSLKIKLPATILQTGTYFAQMTLPLALICAGATLTFSSIKKDIVLTTLSSFSKLILLPLVMTYAGYLWGFRGMNLGVLFLMSSAPSASAGYVMVRSMGGNANLAANIIVLTTVLSLLTTSIGVTILRSLDLM